MGVVFQNKNNYPKRFQLETINDSKECDKGHGIREVLKGISNILGQFSFKTFGIDGVHMIFQTLPILEDKIMKSQIELFILKKRAFLTFLEM